MTSSETLSDTPSPGLDGLCINTIRFLAVGVAATLAHGVTFFLLTAEAKIQPILSNACAALLAILISYFGHRIVTFRSTIPHVSAAPKFILQAALSWLISTLLVIVLVPIVGAWAVSIIIIMVLPLLSYIAYERWTFNSPIQRAAFRSRLSGVRSQKEKPSNAGFSQKVSS